MPRSRRVKLLCLSIDVITELLEWWKAPLTRMVSIPKIDGVPDDVSVEGIYPDVARQCYFARLYHPSFDEVPDGSRPPELIDVIHEFITVGRGDAVEASWRATVEMLNRERDEQLAIKQKEIDHFRQLLDERAMLAIPREQHASEVSADLMNKMADVESKAARYDQLMKEFESQQKRINTFDAMASSPALNRAELWNLIEAARFDRESERWLRSCVDEIDRLRCLVAIEEQKPNRGSNYADYLRPEVINSIRDSLVDCAGKEPGPLHEAARLGLQLADHIRACDAIHEQWNSTAGAALRRAEEILGAGNYDNIDHAAKRVVEERDRLKAELAKTKQPKDDYEAGYRAMREERDELKRQLAMRIESSPPDAPVYPNAFPTDMPF